MEERTFWLEAVQKFRKNINSIIICPSCKIGDLFIIDIAFDEKNIQNGGERYIKCTICCKSEVVLYRTPPENWYFKNTNQKNKITIKQKIHVANISFSGEQYMNEASVEFYCANGSGIKHKVFILQNSPNLNYLVSEGQLDYTTLVKNGVASMLSLEKQTPLLFQYQFFKSDNCSNNYLIIFRLGEWQNGRYVCNIDAIFNIHF